MSNDERMTNSKIELLGNVFRHSTFVIRYPNLVIRASSFQSFVIVACPVKSFRFRDENGNTTHLVWTVRI